MDITWLGHSAFQIKSGETDIVIDPFLTGNPKASTTADELEPNHILLSHGHQDHYGDLVSIAKRTGAQVVAPTEIADELTNELDAEQLHDPNLGGTVTFDWGWVKMVPAWHTSTTPSGTVCTPMGLLIKLEDKVVYFTGDTCLFSDMKLIAQRGDGVDIAILPIGGHYTMDRHDAVAAVEFIAPKTVIPCHFGTFGPIETDAEAFKADVENSTGATCVVLEPGGTHSE
jgi:L-ascorbate metabolism protein UlaG (beta-lactamase superfamily)